MLDKAGMPQVRLLPLTEVSEAEQARIAERRRAAIGMWRAAFHSCDTRIEALQADRVDQDTRYWREIGSSD